MKKKGILAALALALALPVCALGEASYTAGTYSAEAQGMESAVKVTVTVSDSAIISASSAAVRRRESVLCFIVGSFRRRAAARK